MARLAETVKEAVEVYWSGKKDESFKRICKEEGLDPDAFPDLT